MRVQAVGNLRSFGVERWQVIAAVSIANALEWFDFVVFGFLAVTMAKLFFPATDEIASLLLTFATFGITFLMRPLGAIIIGRFADRRGRRAALVLTMALMTVGTLFIAVAPTYAAVGIASPVVILLARALQGFSAGGEFGPATAFLAEQDPKHRGFVTSWQFASQGLTTVLATSFGLALSTLVSPADLEAWAWRIPFVFGVLIGPIAYYIRTRLAETSEFLDLPATTEPLQALVGDRHRVFLCAGSIVVATVTMYTILFMPTFAVKQLGLEPNAAFFAGLLTGMLQILLIPLVGRLSDLYGRMPFMLTAATIVLFTIVPLFSWLVSSPTTLTLLMVQGIIGIVSALYLGGLGGFISELFPTGRRSLGLSVGNAVAVTIFGGFAPFISAWLITETGSKLAPSFYPMFGAILSIWALLAAYRSGFR